MQLRTVFVFDCYLQAVSIGNDVAGRIRCNVKRLQLYHNADVCVGFLIWHGRVLPSVLRVNKSLERDLMPSVGASGEMGRHVGSDRPQVGQSGKL